MIKRLIFLMITCSLFSSIQAQLHSIKVENSIVIDRSADDIWDHVKDHGLLPQLVPEVIATTTVQGEDLMSSWLITLQNGQQIEESMVYYHPELKELSYQMTKTTMPISHYFATQRVEAIDKSSSRILFTAYCNVEISQKELIERTSHNFQNTYLKNLKFMLK